MQQKNSLPVVLRWWFTSKLPIQYAALPIKKGSSTKGLFFLYFRHFLYHPIKRRLARYYLQFLKHFSGLKVIGITGSAGKTTTKEIVYDILKRKGKTVASYANIDPVFNIPTTILKCTPSTRYLVLEMGVEYPGEMDFYLWLAKPDVGVLTNIFPTHTLFLGDINGVRKEKMKLITPLPKNGYAILNNEDLRVKSISRSTKSKVIYFGSNGVIRADRVRLTKDLTINYVLNLKESKINIHLPVFGPHFVLNSLAAAAVGHVLNVSLRDIKAGIENYNTPDHRMKIIKVKNSIIIDDSYNSNPKAAEEAVKSLELLDKNTKKAIVFGDMLELGKKERKYHAEIGNLIGKADVDFLIGVGELSKDTVSKAAKYMRKGTFHTVKDPLEALPLVAPLLTQKYVILVKGSRSIGLDKLVKELSPH